MSTVTWEWWRRAKGIKMTNLCWYLSRRFLLFFTPVVARPHTYPHPQLKVSIPPSSYPSSYDSHPHSLTVHIMSVSLALFLFVQRPRIKLEVDKQLDSEVSIWTWHRPYLSLSHRYDVCCQIEIISRCARLFLFSSPSHAMTFTRKEARCLCQLKKARKMASEKVRWAFSSFLRDDGSGFIVYTRCIAAEENIRKAEQRRVEGCLSSLQNVVESSLKWGEKRAVPSCYTQQQQHTI